MARKAAEGAFGWNRLLTTDIDLSKQFYGQLFGWETFELDIQGVPFFLFKQGKDTIAGMAQIPAEKEGVYRTHWMTYITVLNINDKLEQARNMGGTIISEATFIPGIGKIAIIQDPVAAYVGLFEAA